MIAFAGLTLDIPASNLSTSEEFYARVIGRPADLRSTGGTVEWIVSRGPEIAMRLVEGAAVAPERVRIGLGVVDLRAERRRLGELAAGVGILSKPGVIATLELRDPDGYRVVLWQDLLTA